MNIFAVIMAGGVGSRFWPRSREKSPKQLLKIFGDDTMIQATVKRISKLIDMDKIFIITNEIQKQEMISQLPDISPDQIITEPFGRNTAACIGLVSMHIKKRDPEAVTIVLPADHLIHDEDLFIDNLKEAAQFAFDKKSLLTIGISPTRPETGYGYIQVKDTPPSGNIYRVNSFAEKPNYSTAVQFLSSGDFYWNSGMFIWRVDTILNEIKMYMSELSYGLDKIEAALNTEESQKVTHDVYSNLKSVSIDYGIMEKSKKVYLIKSSFRWSDVGSWEEVYLLSDKDESGNSFTGDVYSDMTLDTYIYSPEKFTAAIGVDNLIIINTKDSLLVCRKDQAQKVKLVVDSLKMKNRNELL